MEQLRAPPRNATLSQLQDVASPPRDLIARQAQEIIAPLQEASVLQAENLTEFPQSTVKRSSQTQKLSADSEARYKDNPFFHSQDTAAEKLSRRSSLSQDTTSQHPRHSAKIRQYERSQEEESLVESINDESQQQIHLEDTAQQKNSLGKGMEVSTVPKQSSTTLSKEVPDAIIPLGLPARLYQTLKLRADRPSQKAEAANLIISATNPHTKGNEPAGATESLWKSAMELYINQLSTKDRRYVHSPQNLCSLNVRNLEEILGPLQAKHDSGKVHKLLKRLHPTINHIRSFAVVLEIALQTHPSPGMLIWASVKLVLEISSRSMQLSQNICDMLESLGRRLPLFERWVRLFPEAEYAELSECITMIYLEYISFLVNTIKYLRRTSLGLLFRTTFSPSFRLNYDKSEKRINELTEHLVLQVHSAGLNATAERDKEMHDLLIAQNRAKQDPATDREFKFTQDICRNSHFFGRDDILEKVSRRLDGFSGRQRSVALHGLVGSGKSQVAAEYMYRNFDHFPVIIWLNASDHVVLETQFTQIARRLGFATTGGNVRAEVLDWLASLRSRWLMVFDNANDITKIRAYWPAAPRGSIIITSRNPTSQEEGLASTGLHVPTFDISHGADFVLYLLEAPADAAGREAAETLSKVFDGLPLGLKIAVSVMIHKNYSLKGFVNLIARRIHDIEKHGVPGGTTSLASLFDFVFSSVSASGIELLDLISFLDPQSIPIDLFEPTEDDQSSAHTLDLPFRNAAESLWLHSLLRFDDTKTSVNVHGYVQSVAYRKLSLSQDRYEQAFKKILARLYQVVPSTCISPNRNPNLWERRERYLPHVRFLESRAPKVLSKEVASHLVELLTSYAYYFYEVGQYLLGLEMIGAATAKIRDHQLSNPRLLSMLSFTEGKIHNESNDPWKAEPSYRRALEDLEPIINYQIAENAADNLYICMVYSGIGTALTAQDRFDEAQKFHSQALDTALKLSTQSPSRLGTLYTNLGSCLLWQGKHQEAEDILHKALLKHDRILECTLYALANTYLAQGRLQESFALHEEVLERFSKELGHSHHATADSCLKLGTLLAHSENEKYDLARAQLFIQKALDRFEFWFEQGIPLMTPYIARTQWKLAQVMRLSQDPDQNAIKDLEMKAEEGFCRWTHHDLTKDPTAIEDAFDKLVFYWSRRIGSGIEMGKFRTIDVSMFMEISPGDFTSVKLIEV